MPHSWEEYTPYQYLRLFVIPLFSQGRRLRNLSLTLPTKAGIREQESIGLEPGFPLNTCGNDKTVCDAIAPHN